MLVALATTACASTANPWRTRDATGDQKGALADHVTVDVACRARTVHALAVGQGPGPSEGARYRKSALLDLVRETSLRFTAADEVRW